jgi:hypothetical protein
MVLFASQDKWISSLTNNRSESVYSIDSEINRAIKEGWKIVPNGFDETFKPANFALEAISSEKQLPIKSISFPCSIENSAFGISK